MRDTRLSNSEFKFIGRLDEAMFEAQDFIIFRAKGGEQFYVVNLKNGKIRIIDIYPTFKFSINSSLFLVKAENVFIIDSTYKIQKISLVTGEVNFAATGMTAAEHRKFYQQFDIPVCKEVL